MQQGSSFSALPKSFSKPQPVLSVRRFFSGKGWFFLDLLALVIFVGINLFAITYHEPWSDEAQPWLLVRDTNFGELFRYLINNYDSHAMLWYFLLIPFVKAGLPFVAQNFLHVFLASAAAAVFLWKAPFSRLTKYLWIFSYYMLFEYSVIPRMYAGAVLLIFLTASVYEKRFERPYLYAFLLALLFNALLVTIVFTSLLAGFFALECLWRYKKQGKPLPLVPLLIAGMGAFILFLQVSFPPADLHFPNEVTPSLERILKAFGNAFIPLRGDTSSFMANVTALTAMFLALVGLRRKPVPFLLLLLSSLSLCYLFMFIHPGDLRHYGFLFIFLLFSLWIEKDHWQWRWEAPLFERVLNRAGLGNALKKTLIIVNVCLLINVRGSWIVHAQDYLYPYSGSTQMAQVINALFEKYDFDEKGFKIVANPHMQTISLLPYMPERKFWYPYMGDFATYYTARRYPIGVRELNHEQVVDHALQHFGTLDHIFFLFKGPINLTEKHGYRLQPIAGAYEKVWGRTYEFFFLYKPVLINQQKTGENNT